VEDRADWEVDDISIEPVIIDAKAEPEEAVKQLFRSAAPFAAMQIIEIAKGKKESRIQFDAAKYVVEAVAPRSGKMTDDPQDQTDKQFTAIAKLLLDDGGSGGTTQ